MTQIIIGAVLTGGASRRFGSDKALATTGDHSLGSRVVAALRAAGLDPVVAVGGDAGPALGLVTIPDRRPGEGPLAALASVLGWATTGAVVVVPCDHPLLDPEDLRRLVDTWRRHPDEATVAVRNGKPLVTVACWPATAARTILAAVDNGDRAFRRALDLVPWQPVEVSSDTTIDADTPRELDALRSRLDDTNTGEGPDAT